jgi:polyisoprenoid-binding protein YceI
MVEFEVKHLWGLHTVRGRFRRFDGVYIVGLPGSEIELTIDAASADTRQRRIGMSQGPLCNVRPPTKLHVKTRLVRGGPE